VLEADSQCTDYYLQYVIDFMKSVRVLIVAAAIVALAGCRDALPPAVTPTPTGLVAWYKLDQNVADSSGNGHDGVDQDVSYVPDRFGGAKSAISLNGSTSFISVANATDLNFDTLASFSISTWIKTKDTSSSYRGIISKGPVGGNLPGYAIGMDKNGKVLAAVSGDRNPTMRSTSSVNNGAWHLITLVVQANTLAALFVDGSLESDFPLTTFYADRNNTSYLFIGKDRTSSNFFSGAIDDVRIYARSLTPMEVVGLFSAGGWIGDTTSTPIDTTTKGGGGSGTYGLNTLDNPSFQTSYSSQGYIDNGTFPPWDVAYGSPRFGAGVGADSIPGYAYLWGTSDDGNAIWQPLSTPIKKGHTYQVTCKVKSNSSQQDFHNQRYVIVRFLAFNQNPGTMHWSLVPGQVAQIGKFTSTSLDTWDSHATLDWTADADYANFEIDASTLASGNGNESWVAIDVVGLYEKQ
jgi:hypothetical protein